jgi:isoamyl acetate esterase
MALPYMVIDDRVRGSFLLSHLDLHYGSMFFDDEHNLTAVIDWSRAQAALLEQLSVCLEFATYPSIPDEENQTILRLKSLCCGFVNGKGVGSRKKGCATLSRAG